MSVTRTADTHRTEGDPTPTPAYPSGATLGRYVVLNPIGEGGMGVVYAAYDYGLERKVALKVVRSSRRESAQRHNQALLREAQAMAKLSHPNIAAVYDVGVTETQAFVAMELLEGGTLAQWLRRRPTWREALPMVLRAGEGLAAAHAAGIVHGDFKPHNVLLGQGAQVRVSDFGLARLAREAADAGEPTEGLQGTPQYMAPELLRGGTPTALSDQYAFFVTLHEALLGRRPFAGDTVEARLAELATPVPLALGDHLPRRLKRALVRGLSPRPEDRYPSLEAALQELAPFHAGPKVWLAAAVVGGGLLVAVGFGQGLLVSRGRCEGAGAPVEGLWSPERRESVRAAFEQASAVVGPESLAKVDLHLGDYARRWREAAVGACEASAETAGPEAELRAARERCLGARLREARALVDTLAGVKNAESLPRASEASASLPSPHDCLDEAWVRVWGRLPGGTDPEKSAALAQQLAEAHARASLGQYAEALPVAIRVAEGARALEDLPLLARATYEQGTLSERVHPKNDAALVALEEAVLLAEEAGDDLTQIAAHSDLVWTLGIRRGEHQAAAMHARHAHALLKRIGGAPRYEVELLNREMQVTFDPSTAFALGRRAVALGEQTLGADEPVVLSVTVQLANKLVDSGHSDEAGTILESVRGRLERELGASHPMMGLVLRVQASLAREAKDYERALALTRELYALRLRFVSPTHERAVLTHFDFGHIYYKMGDFERALDETDAAIHGLEKTGGKGPNFGSAHHNRGDLLRLMGRPKDAIAHLEIAAANYDPVTARSQLAQTIATLAWAQLDAGEVAAAERSLQRAAKVCGAPAKDGLCHGRTHALLARVALARRQTEKARQELELAASTPDEADAVGLAMARFGLAQVLSPAPSRPDARALRLAKEAREGYAKEGQAYAGELKAIDAWVSSRELARH